MEEWWQGRKGRGGKVAGCAKVEGLNVGLRKGGRGKGYSDEQKEDQSYVSWFYKSTGKAHQILLLI